MEFRTGAQCVKIICAEPSTNTPGAQRRLDMFIQPFLEQAGVQIDFGRKGKPRWLKDRLQLPGVIRRYVVDHRSCWREDVIHDSLDLLFPAHRLEVAVLVEHTNCAERHAAFRHDHHREMNATEEPFLIRNDLHRAEQLLRAWHDRRNGEGRLFVVKAVGLVSESRLACERRLERIISLKQYLDEQEIPDICDPIAFDDQAASY